ncbi:unnamed protein product [Gordionus sp. m RMFG-2023]
MSSESFKKILSNVQQIVGYNPSFLSMRNLFNDEISNMAMSFMQIINSKHPLLKNTKKLIYGDYNIVQMHGLIILLIAKLFGIPKNFTNTTLSENEQGITQKSLSEVTQMIYLARMIHKGILEFEDETFEKSIIIGNNLAILSGDYLLACACRDLAKLEDTSVVEKMSQAIADLMVLEYKEYEDIQNFNNVNIINQSIDKKFFNLLAYGSYSTLTLVNHPINFKKLAFDFGDQLGTALELYVKIKEPKHFNNVQKSVLVQNCVFQFQSALNTLSIVTSIESNIKSIFKDVINSFLDSINQINTNRDIPTIHHDT